jgi:hypothetical protein
MIRSRRRGRRWVDRWDWTRPPLHVHDRGSPCRPSSTTRYVSPSTMTAGFLCLAPPVIVEPILPRHQDRRDIQQFALGVRGVVKPPGMVRTRIPQLGGKVDPREVRVGTVAHDGHRHADKHPWGRTIVNATIIVVQSTPRASAPSPPGPRPRQR